MQCYTEDLMTSESLRRTYWIDSSKCGAPGGPHVLEAKVGLASGSIVLLVGSSALRSTGHLPASFASPLSLLTFSVLYGVFFMAFEMLNYESYRHGPKNYTRFKYSRNLALGFACLLCFCVGYLWLILLVTE